MELADILRSLRRRWRIAVAILLLTGVVVAVVLATREEVTPTPRFGAESSILVPTRDDDGNVPEGTPARLLFGQSAIALSGAVRGAALADANVPPEERAGVSFGYEMNEEGDIVTLSVQAGSAQQARAVADAWASAYIRERADAVATGSSQSQASARRSLQVFKTRLAEIERQMQAMDPALLGITVAPESDSGSDVPTVPSGLSVDAALLVYERASVQQRIEETGQAYAEGATSALVPGTFATIVEVPPVINTTPPADSPQTPTLLIVGIGLLLALGLPVLIDRMDHTIRDAKTATAALSAPLLSSIPATSRAGRDEIAKPGTPREAAFRALAATSVATDRLPRSIVVTSPLGEMQDSVAANFAAALAGMGVRVALIGTSPRQAWFTRVLIAEHGNGAEKRNGDGSLTTFPQLLELAYAGRLNGEAPSHLLRTRFDNLFVLPPGDNDIDVANDGLPPMLEALADHIDVTVIAAPALLEDPNTTIYAWTTRSVLWVMESGEIKVEEARNAASRLALAGVTPFGVAMIDQES